MERRQSDGLPKSEYKWESTLLYVAIIMAIVISIMGCYLEKDVKTGYAPAVETTLR